MAIRRRWPLRIALVAVLLLAAPIILPIPLPLDFARERLAVAASDALGHAVRIDGARLTTGLTPVLRLRGVAVAGAPAIDARVEQLEAEFLLLPLLAGELRVLAVRVEGVAAELEPAAWPDARPAGAAAAPGLRASGPRQVVVKRAAATLRLAAGPQPLRLAIDEAEAAAAPAGRARVTARGRVQDLPVTLTLETAAPGALADAGAALPIDLTVTLADGKATVNGTWDRARAEVDLSVAVQAAQPERLAAAFGVGLPAAGALALRGQLTAAPSRFAAKNLQIDWGQSRVEGAAAYATDRERPLVTADLRAPVLDLHPFAAGDDEAAPPLKRLAAALGMPRQIDADVKVGVAQLLTPLADVTDARLDLRVAAATLTASLKGRVDGVPLTADARVDASGSNPALTLTAGATDVPLDQVTQRLGRSDLGGSAGKLSFRLDAAGADADALRAGFKLTATAEQLRLAERAPPRREVARLRTLRVDAAGKGDSAIRAEGTAWGERATLSATTKELGALLGGRLSPVSFEVGIASARVSGSGELSHGTDGARGRLRVEAGARPIGPLHNLLPVNPASALNATVAAAVEFRDERIVIDAATLRLGASAGRGRLVLPAGRGAAPRRVELALENLDLGELQRALPAATAPRAPAAPPPDLAFELAARTVRYGDQRVDDAQVSGELRGGRVAAAPFSARFGGTRVSGTTGADLREAEPRFDFDATASPLDLGTLLALAGAPGYKGRAERATLKASLRGAGAADLLRHASAQLALEQASFALPEYFTPKTLDFSAQAQLAPGQPLTAALQGSAGGTAVEAAARLDDPGALLAAAPASPFQIDLRGADTSVQFSGALGDARGRVVLAGRNPADLAPLLDLDPPDLGPYRADAELAWKGTQLNAPRFAVKIGESSADGEFTIDWRGERPRLKLSLTSPRVRFEDIGIGDPLREGRAGTPSPPAHAATDRASRLAAWRAFLRAYDGEVRIDAQRVESGGDLLGRGLYHERRENGRVEVSPLLVEAEGARLTVTGAVDAAADGDPGYQLRAILENFDLAALARGAGRAGRGFGTLDARAQLSSRGLPDEFLVNASGEVDAMFIGEDLASGGLDLLTTGLLRVVANTLHGERESRVNCAVGDFVLAEGVVESQAFFIDTTRSRVAGDLRADLRTRALSGVLEPRAKRPQLFSVATPLTIGGTMENPRVTVSPVGIATGTLRLYLFAPTLALDWLNARGLPEDGTPDCRNAFRELAN